MKLTERVRRMQADGMTAAKENGRTILRHRDGRPLDITDAFRSHAPDGPFDGGPTFWAIVDQVKRGQLTWSCAFEAWYVKVYPYGNVDRATALETYNKNTKMVVAFRHFVGDKTFDILIATEDDTDGVDSSPFNTN